MVHSIADDFAAEVATLCAIDVSRGQWAQFLDRHVPREDPTTDKPLEGRALTMADTKRAVLQRLYDHDSRVAPWAGTAHGVLQAVNTYDTTKAPSGEHPEPTATCSAPSPETSAGSTGRPGRSCRGLSRSRNDRWGGTALRPQSLSAGRSQGSPRLLLMGGHPHLAAVDLLQGEYVDCNGSSPQHVARVESM